MSSHNNTKYNSIQYDPYTLCSNEWRDIFFNWLSQTKKSLYKKRTITHVFDKYVYVYIYVYRRINIMYIDSSLAFYAHKMAGIECAIYIIDMCMYHRLQMCMDYRLYTLN